MSLRLPPARWLWPLLGVALVLLALLAWLGSRGTAADAVARRRKTTTV